MQDAVVMPEDALLTTDDGHYIIVNGRCWRATDPRIPPQLREMLVNELMAARRAVRTEGDSARHRVHDAKVALGERGAPWWEPVTDDGLTSRIEATIRCLLRGRSGSLCPSEVARVVDGEQWRSLMARVRSVAWQMTRDGVVQVTQGGVPAEPTASGPVRIARGPSWADEERRLAERS